MNYTPLLISLGIGLIVGLSMGIFGSRRKKQVMIYIFAGMFGAGMFSLLPILKGADYFNMSVKYTTVIAVFFTGLAIMFGSAKK